MASSASSCELFKDGVRAVLHTWPVLQVNTSTSGTPGGQVAGRQDALKSGQRLGRCGSETRSCSKVPKPAPGSIYSDLPQANPLTDEIRT